MLLCEIEGRVLGAMQFEVLVDAACELDGRVLGGMQFEVQVDAALRD